MAASKNYSKSFLLEAPSGQHENKETKARALQEQRLAVLQRQRAEYAKMEVKLSGLKKGGAAEKATVLARLRDIDADIAKLSADLSPAESAPRKSLYDDIREGTAKRPVAEEPPLADFIDADSILRKYSSTAAFERYKKSARLERKLTETKDEAADKAQRATPAATLEKKSA